MLSMDAYERKENAIRIIKQLVEKLRQYAPMDATHEGIENCDLIVNNNAWLAVKRSELVEFGIIDKISNYSYENGKTVYLEEDSDGD